MSFWEIAGGIMTWGMVAWILYFLARYLKEGDFWGDLLTLVQR